MVIDPGVMTTFAIAALLLIMMPGPDQVLVTRNALSGGRRGGLLTMVGGALGLGVHATAAAVGLSALLLASSTAFTALKVVGVAYLLWLGVQTWRSARRTRLEPAEEAEEAPGAAALVGVPAPGLPLERPQPQGRAVLRHLPAAVPARPMMCLAAARRVATRCCSRRCSRVCTSRGSAATRCWSTASAPWLRRPSVKARIERVTGFALVTFAARLATASH